MKVMILKVFLILALAFPTIAYGIGEVPEKVEEAEAKELKKEEVEETEKAEEKVLKTSQVSKQMAQVWCEKLEECTSGEEMGLKECRKVLKKSFQDGFKNAIEGQKVGVTQTKLSQCSASIKKDTCEALKKAQTLEGCEFISLLNRPS